MTVMGISSSAALMTQSLLDLNNQLSNLQQQLATGQKSQTYSGLGAQRGLTVGLQSQLAAMSGFDNTITSVGAQLSVAQTALQGIATAAQTVQNSAVISTFSSSQNGQTIDQQAAAGQLDQVLSTLNTQSGNNYIFSGMSPNQPAVNTTDNILNGNGTQAGFKQVLSERQQADGVGALGRLVIPAASGNKVTISEDAVGSPFGLKLASVTSNLTGGATVSGPSGPPANPNSVTVDFTGGNPAPGDTIKFTFNLPDGTTQDMTLTATTASPPGTGQFTIGSTPATTAANFQSALSSGVTKIADTTLYGASAMAAANDFFNVDATHPPMRVNGSPPSTATSLVPGTSSNTITWYTGEAGSTPAINTATATVDQSQTVSFGMRANEQALRNVVENLAVFGATTYSSSDPNAAGQYSSVMQRVSANLNNPPGTQTVTDIEAQIASAQSSMKAAQSRHQQTSTVLTNFLQSIEGVDNTQVGEQILTLQTQLQASLQTTSMLSKLSLVNYLPPA
jgi:flagellar hook-associated protein 3 FlgL